jgi:hypothetical protein
MEEQGRKPDKKKGFWRWLWWFLWEDNSIWSWIANIIIAFILIKFVIYPGLGFLFGTGYPIVAVVSGSMEHDGMDFNTWWAHPQCCADASCSKRAPQSDIYAKYGITPEDFQHFKFSDGFNKGDIMILTGPRSLAIGDTLVFWGDANQEPIIHRIVQAKNSPDAVAYNTKGDHNCGSASFEDGITAQRMIGKAVLRIPLLGWIKIGFVELLKQTGVTN